MRKPLLHLVEHMAEQEAESVVHHTELASSVDGADTLPEELVEVGDQESVEALAGSSVVVVVCEPRHQVAVLGDARHLVDVRMFAGVEEGQEAPGDFGVAVHGEHPPSVAEEASWRPC